LTEKNNLSILTWKKIKPAGNGGVVYFPNQVDALIKSLLEDDNYKAIEKTG
jgi:hypothetical protein